MDELGLAGPRLSSPSRRCPCRRRPPGRGRPGASRAPTAASASAALSFVWERALSWVGKTSLLRRPTGLAVGLALKEPAPPPRWVRPNWLVSPLPARRSGGDSALPVIDGAAPYRIRQIPASDLLTYRVRMAGERLRRGSSRRCGVRSAHSMIRCESATTSPPSVTSTGTAAGPSSSTSCALGHQVQEARPDPSPRTLITSGSWPAILRACRRCGRDGRRADRLKGAPADVELHGGAYPLAS